MTSGIYRIKNKRNGKEYIGQSKNIEQRFEQHKKQLENGKHKNKKLQEDYNKGHQFSYEIIRRSRSSDRDSLDRLEENYIKRLDTKRKGYNRTWGGRTDKYASEEYRRKHRKTSSKRKTYSKTKSKRYNSRSRHSNTKPIQPGDHVKNPRYYGNNRIPVNYANHVGKKEDWIECPYCGKSNNMIWIKQYGKCHNCSAEIELSEFTENLNEPENSKNNNEKNEILTINDDEKKSQKVNINNIKTNNICPNCKKEIDSTDNFCIYCGTKINKEQQ